MSRKLAPQTQVMANIFPAWTSVRYDEQSLGQRLLNGFAQPIDRAQKELTRMSKNLSLVTTNLDEMSWLYHVDLEYDENFSLNTNDYLLSQINPPVVSGILDSVAYPVTLCSQNDLETFWWSAIPDRISYSETFSGEHILLEDFAQNAPFFTFSGTLPAPHPLYITLSGGTEYVYVEEDTNRLVRAYVVIKGITEKGTTEEEILAYPWDQKQQTLKSWASISSIDCWEVPSGVAVRVASYDFDNGPYIDFWNTMDSEDREKIDQFWNVGDADGVATLDFWRYTTGNVRDMLGGCYDIYQDRRFELLDTDGSGIAAAVDMARQPFSDNLWVATANHLYLYDSNLTTVDDVGALATVTPNNAILLDFDLNHIVRGDPVTINFISAGPVPPVNQFKNWVQYPDGTKSGILGGGLVSYASHTFTPAGAYDKFIDTRLTFTPDQLGEHVFTIEAVMSDGTTQIAKRVLCVDSKTALAEFDFSASLVASGVNGITFDQDQIMLISTSSGGYHPINLHYDTMMIDYENKVLFFREPYDEVRIWVDGL
jgi:hypothetical protein